MYESTGKSQFASSENTIKMQMVLIEIQIRSYLGDDAYARK